MTTFELTTAAGTPGLLARLAATTAAIRGNLARRAIYRQTVRELGALRDRDLADLGIERSAIRSLAQQAARDAVV